MSNNTRHVKSSTISKIYSQVKVVYYSLRININSESTFLENEFVEFESHFHHIRYRNSFLL
jgi:hypothetical protein